MDKKFIGAFISAAIFLIIYSFTIDKIYLHLAISIILIFRTVFFPGGRDASSKHKVIFSELNGIIYLTLFISLLFLGLTKTQSNEISDIYYYPDIIERIKKKIGAKAAEIKERESISESKIADLYSQFATNADVAGMRQDIPDIKTVYLPPNKYGIHPSRGDNVNILAEGQRIATDAGAAAAGALPAAQTRIRTGADPETRKPEFLTKYDIHLHKTEKRRDAMNELEKLSKGGIVKALSVINNIPNIYEKITGSNIILSIIVIYTILLLLFTTSDHAIITDCSGNSCGKDNKKCPKCRGMLRTYLYKVRNVLFNWNYVEDYVDKDKTESETNDDGVIITRNKNYTGDKTVPYVLLGICTAKIITNTIKGTDDIVKTLLKKINIIKFIVTLSSMAVKHKGATLLLALGLFELITYYKTEWREDYLYLDKKKYDLVKKDASNNEISDEDDFDHYGEREVFKTNKFLLWNSERISYWHLQAYILSYIALGIGTYQINKLYSIKNLVAPAIILIIAYIIYKNRQKISKQLNLDNILFSNKLIFYKKPTYLENIRKREMDINAIKNPVDFEPYRNNYTVGISVWVNNKQVIETKNKFYTILNFNANPQISLNQYTNELKITFTHNTPLENKPIEKIIYIDSIKSQRWNNITVVYNKSTVYVYIDDYFVAEVSNVIPTFQSYSITEPAKNNNISLTVGDYNTNLKIAVKNITLYPKAFSISDVKIKNLLDKIYY
jgi:hypothetical protein